MGCGGLGCPAALYLGREWIALQIFEFIYKQFLLCWAVFTCDKTVGRFWFVEFLKFVACHMIHTIRKYRCWRHLGKLLLAMKFTESTGILDMDLDSDPDPNEYRYTIISHYILVHPYTTTFDHKRPYKTAYTITADRIQPYTILYRPYTTRYSTRSLLTIANIFLLSSWRPPTRRAGSGSGSVSLLYGSADPDPYQMSRIHKLWHS